jgi:hypothetical protein
VPTCLAHSPLARRIPARRSRPGLP